MNPERLEQLASELLALAQLQRRLAPVLAAIEADERKVQDAAPLGPGQGRRTDLAEPLSIRKKLKGGTNETYLAARIKRDAPVQEIERLAPTPLEAAAPVRPGGEIGANPEPDAITCRECGAAFVPSARAGARQRYCGSTCRKAASAQRQKAAPRARRQASPAADDGNGQDDKGRGPSARPAPAGGQDAAPRTEATIAELTAPPTLPAPCHGLSERQFSVGARQWPT